MLPNFQKQTGINHYGQVVHNYKLQQILTSPPERLILYLYDMAVKGCIKKEEKLVSKVLVQLIDAINFDYGEISAGLFRLYHYIMDLVKSGDFDQALTMFRGLRDAWYTALQSKTQRSEKT